MVSLWSQRGSLLFGIATVLLFGTAFSCTCLVQTNEEKFCSAHVALRARVMDSGRVFGSDKIYRIMPYRLYRSTVPSSDLNLFQVATGTNSAACGVYLQRGQQYFFTGFVEQTPRRSRSRWYRPLRRIRVSSCGWVQRYNTLTRSERRFIRNPYSCSRGRYR